MRIHRHDEEYAAPAEYECALYRSAAEGKRSDGEAKESERDFAHADGVRDLEERQAGTRRFRRGADGGIDRRRVEIGRERDETHEESGEEEE